MSATTRRPGKRLQKWVSVKGTKRDAERRLAELIKDLDTGTFVEPTAITVDAYLDLWLRDYVTLAVRLNTADFYRGVVQRLKDGLGCVRLADLKPQHVQRYYADLLDRGLSCSDVPERPPGAQPGHRTGGQVGHALAKRHEAGHSSARCEAEDEGA